MTGRLLHVALKILGGLVLVTSLGASTFALSATPATPSAVPPTSRPQTEAERKAFAPGDKSPAAIVNAFNQRAFFDHDPVGAMKKYLSDDFIERYPDLSVDGPGSDKQRTISFFETRGWKPGEAMTDTIYQVITNNDYAVVYHRVTHGPEDRGIAYVDMFRVVDGLIVEHWAVGQPVSSKVSARHPMF